MVVSIPVLRLRERRLFGRWVFPADVGAGGGDSLERFVFRGYIRISSVSVLCHPQGVVVCRLFFCVRAQGQRYVCPPSLFEGVVHRVRRKLWMRVYILRCARSTWAVWAGIPRGMTQFVVRTSLCCAFIRFLSGEDYCATSAAEVVSFISERNHETPSHAEQA